MVVAEKCRGASQADGKIIGVYDLTEVADTRRWGARFSVNGEYIAGAIYHCNDQRIGNRTCRRLDDCLNVG